jgi:ribonucleoside-diphosphate reductase alpha chain
MVFSHGNVIEKRTDQLKVGDYIVGSNFSIKDNWPFKRYWNIGGFSINEDFAWLLGYFMGDGSLGPYIKDKKRIRFFDQSGETLEKVCKILRKIIGIKYKIQKDNRSKTKYVVSYDRRLIKFFEETIGLKGNKDFDIFIPNFIFKSPLTVISSFIAGLIDSDGYVDSEKIRISYSTSSKRMLQDLVFLLSLLGFRTAWRQRIPKKKNWALMYEIYIDTKYQLYMFWEFIGRYLIGKEKKDRLRNFALKITKYTSRSCPLAFKDIEPFLNKLGVDTKCSLIHRKSIWIEGRKFWLARWKWRKGVSLDKVIELINILLGSGKFERKDKERLLFWKKVLPSLYQIIKIEKNPGVSEFYDFTIQKNNNYLSGENGFALIHNTGFDFSHLRPKNSRVRSTDGVSSGPISFMKVYNASTQEIKQGGRRRGANMGILRIDHPDILEFITCKTNNKEITNFNISVAITDEFMKKVENDEEYELVDPHTKKAVRKLKAREVFDLIVKQAWKNGEPGIIFIDRMNQYNPTPHLGKYESTNPCGEQVLLPYESCNLGSINLSKMLKQEEGKFIIDWEKLKNTTHTAVHFLDNVIDMNKFPLPQIEEKTKLTRKIGLGVMGWADMLVRLGIAYNSEEAINLAEKVMSFILNEAIIKSQKLAQEKDVFPAYQGSIWEKRGIRMRNATLTTIAPTGTISIISNCSSGIEPLFALAFTRHVLDKEKLPEINPYFEKIAKERGFYSEDLMRKIAETGSCQHIDEVPSDIKKIFVTAHDISPQWHVRMQASFQKFTNNATSKTINFPNSATIEDVRNSYLLAYKLGCKGITIYRDKSREEQVINIGKEKGKESPIQVIPGTFKITPRPRPQVVRGTTTKIATGCGTLYVTINEDEKSHPFEVFMQMGKAGGCAASQLEAVGRLVSLALRSGVDPKTIIEQLRGIRCPSPAWEKGGTRIFSCADAIAKVLEDRIRDRLQENKTNKEKIDFSHFQVNNGKRINVVGVCPDCGSALYHEEGCVKCMSCGYSKC